jgi:molybdopterin biosynthesis enzyme MoaB
MKTTRPSQGLKVRVLGLGEEGAGASDAVLREIFKAWSARFELDISSRQTGEDRHAASKAIRGWCDREGVDVVLTVGCCGHRHEDFAPEMTAPLLDRPLPGVEERICLAPPSRPEHLLFRGRAGMRAGSLIVNLPASAARTRTIAGFLAPVIGHALEKARGSDRECFSPGEGR